MFKTKYRRVARFFLRPFGSISFLISIIAFNKLNGCYVASSDAKKNAAACDVLIQEISHKLDKYESEKGNSINDVRDCRRYLDDYMDSQEKLLRLVLETAPFGTVYSEMTLRELLNIRMSCMIHPDSFDLLSSRALDIALISPWNYKDIKNGIAVIKDGLLHEPALASQILYCLTFELHSDYSTPLKLILITLEIDRIFTSAKPTPKAFGRLKKILPKILSKHPDRVINDFRTKSSHSGSYDAAIKKYADIRDSAQPWIDLLLNATNQNFSALLSKSIIDKGNYLWIPYFRPSKPDSVNQEKVNSLIKRIGLCGDRVAYKILFDLFGMPKFCEDCLERPSFRGDVFQSISSIECFSGIRVKNSINNFDEMRRYLVSREPKPQTVIELQIPVDLPEWTEEEQLWMRGKETYDREICADILANSGRRPSNMSDISSSSPSPRIGINSRSNGSPLSASSSADFPKTPPFSPLARISEMPRLPLPPAASQPKTKQSDKESSALESPKQASSEASEDAQFEQMHESEGASPATTKSSDPLSKE